MENARKFYIDGAWVDPVTPAYLDVIDPSNEEPFEQIAVGSAADVDRAVAAAKAAFPRFSQTSRQERLALLQRILAAYHARYEHVAQTLTREMGNGREYADFGLEEFLETKAMIGYAAA